MSVIEGIGDEVLQFFGIVFVTLISFIAWWSTGIRERPQIRTVLILEHRSTNNIPVSNHTANTSQNETESVQQNSEVEVTENDRSESESSTPNELNHVSKEDTAEVNVNVGSTIPDSELIKERRLAYFQSQKTGVTVNNAENSYVEAESEVTENERESSQPADNIRIRLKYLNDDQKLVEGKLQEMLGDFKRRHFSGELYADKLVRLIFNGQVLQCENQTLQGYGLYDNCVVHCLVHTQRTNINRSNTQPQANTSPHECNLGLLLYALLSIILGFGWFFRYHYAQFFTGATTAGLVGLTALFAVLVIGLHVPDQETVPTQ